MNALKCYAYNELDQKIDDFRSYSPINVNRCTNIYSIFSQVHHVNVRRCQFFGHVHQFRSS